MIVGFKSKAAEDLFHGISSKESRKFPPSIWGPAQRKLDLLNAASAILDLKSPPGNRLKLLKGSLKGKWSIRINDQYRILFEFKNGNAYQVDVTDYH